jgi:predicted acylesterase/phospholipase RssA
MPELLIRPLGDDGKPIKDFKPLSPVNDARDAPVPILVLNSTTLNTAHSFRFEAEYVGEPEAQAGGRLDVDKNTRLIRMPYQSLPKSQRRRFTLGFAVSASAAFPVGFAPLVVDKLYGVDKIGRRTKYLVRLTDGGVRDNQGIDGLLDAGCTDMLISDGSSPTADIEEPAGTIVGVLPRVLAIGGKESREQRVYYAFARDPNAKVRFMHLQTGLQPRTLDPFKMRTPAGPYRDEYAAPWPTGLDPDASCSSPGSVPISTPSQTWSASRSRRSATARPAVRPALDSGQNEWTQRRLRVAEKKFFKPLLLMLERIRVPGWARILLLDAFPALFLLAGIAIGGVLVGGNVSVPTLYGVLAGLVSLVAFLAVLYLKAGTRGFRLLSRIVFGGLLYVPLIPVLYLGGWLMVGVGSLHVRLGRIRVVPG